MFEIGEKVIVDHAIPDWPGYWVTAMNDFIGQEVTIKKIQKKELEAWAWAYIEESDYFFPPECFRKIVEAPMPKPPEIKKPKPPKVKPETLSSLRKSLIKEVNEKGIGACSYAMLMRNGKIRSHIRDVCNARLNGDVKEAVFAIHEYPVIDDPRYKEYIQYILKESPFSISFVTKQFHVAKRYGIVLNMDVPLPIVYGSCIAMREGSEFSVKLDLFDKLIKKKFSKHTAYLISAIAKKAMSGEYTLTGMAGGHWALSNTLKEEDILRVFANGITIPKEAQPFRLRGIVEYGSCERMMVGSQDTSNKKTFYAYCRRILPEKKNVSWDKPALYSLDDLMNLAKQLETDLEKAKVKV